MAEATVRDTPGWEVVTPAQMGIVTFRWGPKGTSLEESNAVNRGLVEEMIGDGFAMVSSTELRGKTVLRMCTINPRTTETDIRETIHRLDQFSRRRSPA